MLRLITRGLERNRRGGSSRSVISRRLWVMDRASREGGKRRLPGDMAADDAKGAGEGDPVKIVPGLGGSLVHQVLQRVVDQQEREGVVPGTVPPPLSTVYIHQHATAYRGLDAVPDDEARTPADALLDRPDDVIVFGGPGFGKSSLLRSWIITVARRWTDEHFYHSVPVLVRASDLVAVRAKPAVLRRLRLTAEQWQQHQLVPVKTEGLPECLPWFGLA